MSDDKPGDRKPRDAARFDHFMSLLDETDADPERTQVSATLASLRRAPPVLPQPPAHPAGSHPTPHPAPSPHSASHPGTGANRRPTAPHAHAHPKPGPGPQAFEPALAIGLPNDHGLTGAGLLCEALSGFGLAMSAFVFLVLASSLDGLTRFMPLQLDALTTFALILCVARSVMHGMLGRALTRRDPARMFRYVRWYFGVAVVQTILLALAFGNASGAANVLGATGLLGVSGVIAVSFAWPLVLLFMVLRPANRRAIEVEEAFGVKLLPNDRGVASAGVLMLIGGALTLVTLLTTLFDRTSSLRKSWIGWVILLLLFARSAAHTYAGARALRRPSAGDFADGVAVYRVAAWVSAIAIAVVFAIGSLAFSPVALLMLVAFTYLWFLLWPRRISRFTVQVAAEVRADDMNKPLPQAPDGGLTALGYVLLWAACYQLAMVVGALSIVTASGALVWLLLLVPVILMFWAGFELARMSARWRVATWVYVGGTIAADIALAALGAASATLWASLALAVLAAILASRRLTFAPGFVRAFEG